MTPSEVAQVVAFAATVLGFVSLLTSALLKLVP